MNRPAHPPPRPRHTDPHIILRVQRQEMLADVPYGLNEAPSLENVRPGPILIRGKGPGNAAINRFHVKHSSRN